MSRMSLFRNQAEEIGFNGRAIATLLRLSSVCDVMYCG